MCSTQGNIPEGNTLATGRYLEANLRWLAASFPALSAPLVLQQFCFLRMTPPAALQTQPLLYKTTVEGAMENEAVPSASLLKIQHRDVWIMGGNTFYTQYGGRRKDSSVPDESQQSSKL